MINIKFKEKTCRNKYGECQTRHNKYIRMYVVLTHKCNACCKFCEFTYGEVDVNTTEFTRVLKTVSKECCLASIHFTGGEPTTDIDKLTELLGIIKTTDKNILTSVNTNGYNLKLLGGIDELDNIAISRHALTDEENYKIFGCQSIPTFSDIQLFPDKPKLHLSCNLIKGYIDTPSRMLDYLEMSASLGIISTGFVSLMQINDYCKEHHIGFDNQFTSDRILKSNWQENEVDGKVLCKCENYLYRAKNGNIVSTYHRYAIRNKEIADYLVYENNVLKQGFNGSKIDI